MAILGRGHYQQNHRGSLSKDSRWGVIRCKSVHPKAGIRLPQQPKPYCRRPPSAHATVITPGNEQSKRAATMQTTTSQVERVASKRVRANPHITRPFKVVISRQRQLMSANHRLLDWPKSYMAEPSKEVLGIPGAGMQEGGRGTN